MTPLDPDVVRLLQRLAETGGPPPFEVPVYQARASCNATYEPLMPEIDQGATSSERVVIRGDESPIEIKVFRPTRVEPRGVGIYFHGGGWVVGDTSLLEAPTRLISELAEVTVVSVEYRRAPEHPFPAAFDDCLAATDWVSSEFAGDLPIVLFGESAGGNLTAAVVAELSARRGAHVAGQVVIVPALDPDMAGESWERFGEGYGLDHAEMAWFWDSYLQNPADRSDRRACPLASPDIGLLPATTVITCGYDPLQDEGRTYVRRLSSQGVDVHALHFESLSHGFFWTAGEVPAALAAVQDIALEIRRLTLMA